MHGMDHIPGGSGGVPYKEPCGDRDSRRRIAEEHQKDCRASDPCCCICSSDLLLLQKPELYRCYAAHKQKDPDLNDSVLYDLRDRAGLHRANADQLYRAEIL